MSDCGSGSSTGGKAPVPLFLFASASEVKSSAISLDAPAWRHALGNLAAGAISGCAVEAALYPIDTIKTRLQAMVGGGGFKALMNAGGGKALYAGVWGNLAGTAPSSAIFISVYEPIKKAVLARVGAEQQFLGPLLAGVGAGLCSSLTRVPTEVIKSRLQTGQFTGAVQAVRSILASEGARGLYAGYGAFILRDLPFDAIEFVTYEQLKTFTSKSLKRDLNSGEISLIGAIAGGFTGLVTTPLDVLKTRLMTQGASGRYANLLDATATILRTEGPSAFLAGWQPRLIWISLGGLVFFPVLEATKEFFAPKASGWDVTPLNVYPGKVVTREDFIRCSCSSAKVYQACFSLLSRALSVRPPPSLRDLVLRGGCLHLEAAVARCLAQHRTAFLETLDVQERRSADFSRPVFITAAYCLVARQHKVKVDQRALCRDLGVSVADFAATQASMVALNPDLAPPTTEKTPSALKRRRGSGVPVGAGSGSPAEGGQGAAPSAPGAADTRSAAPAAKRSKRKVATDEWQQLAAEADAVVALQLVGQRAFK